MEKVRFGKCDECGKIIYFKDRVIHTDWAEWFCSTDCWLKRKVSINVENGYRVPIKAVWEIAEL